MSHIRRSGPARGRSDTHLPDSVHAQIDWENDLHYALGHAAGYRQALADLADEWARATGEQPRTHRGTIRWLIRDMERRPEPYSSSANGTTLGVEERDVLGRWAA